MTSDLIALLDRERREVELQKDIIAFLQRHCNESFEQARIANTQVDKLRGALETQQTENNNLKAWIDTLKIRVSHYINKVEHYRGRFLWALKKIHEQRREIAKSEIPYPTAASESYAAQNELDLLRTIRRSQGEGILKLRQQLTEACTERDAASHRANAWRMDYNQMKQDRDVIKDERDVAREGLAQARAEIQKLNEQVAFLRDMREKAIHKFNDYCKELEQARRANRGLNQDRQKLYREMDILRNQLAVSQAVNHIVARREKNNPRLEMILEESYRNEFKRNIDNQKATDSPNCPSS